MKSLTKVLSVLLAAVMTITGITVAFADGEAVTESGDNNTFETATVFAFDGSAKGTIDSTEDVDFFSFTVADAGYYTAKIAHCGEGTDNTYFKVSVFDKDQKSLAAFNSQGNVKESVSSEFYADAGTCFIKVAPGNSIADYEYTLTVSKAEIDGKAESEPNNDTSTANDVSFVTTETPGTSKNFGVISEGDTDYYCFTVPTGYISLNLKNGDSNKGSYTFTIIQKISGVAYEISETELKNTDTDWVYGNETGVKEGLYYLKVTGTSGSTGSYYFEIYSKAGATNEAEYNNSKDYANNLLAGKYLWASMNKADDVDVFAVTTTDTDSIAVTLEGGSSAAEETWKVLITDSKGSEVFSGQFSAGAKAEYSFSKNDAGTYYIEVTSGTNCANSDYKISASRVDPEKEENPGSLWDQIKAMNWGEFWTRNFDFTKFISFLPLLYDLFRTSIGTILKIFSR